MGIKRTIRSGEPCGVHRACLAHQSHPCEGCGRIGGKGEIVVLEEKFTGRKRIIKKDDKTDSTSNLKHL